MSRSNATNREADRTPDILGKRVRVWDKAIRSWKVATVRAICSDPVRRLPNGTYSATKRFEVIVAGTRAPRTCSLEDLRPLRGRKWPKAAGKVTAAEGALIDRAIDLIGKRVRVWYASAREWKVVTVQHVWLGVAPGVPEGAYFRVTRAGKVNPYYYSMAEIQPLDGKTPARREQAARRTSSTEPGRKGSSQRRRQL